MPPQTAEIPTAIPSRANWPEFGDGSQPPQSPSTRVIRDCVAGENWIAPAPFHVDSDHPGQASTGPLQSQEHVQLPVPLQADEAAVEETVVNTEARATLHSAQGAEIGYVTATVTTAGLQIDLAARGLPMAHVDTRGCAGAFIDALQLAAPQAEVMLLHAEWYWPPNR